MGRRWQLSSLLKENKSTCKAFTLEGVSFSYRDTKSLVLDSIDLECQEGEWLVVIGRNGSGKSTLLKFLNALLVPQRGVCFVFGLDTSHSPNVADIRNQVAMVFQNPESQIVGVTVEDDAAFALENQCLSPEEIERRITFSLGKTG
jgi:energy-coupling factor transport system ATP-binding protein